MIACRFVILSTISIFSLNLVVLKAEGRNSDEEVGEKLVNIKQCGTRGQDSVELPWLVKIIANLFEQTDTLLCEGSIIGPKYILTTAYCLELNRTDLTNQLLVLLEERNLKCHNKPCYQNIYINVKERIIHPDYIRDTSSNDIAILELDKRIMFSENIKPICLPIQLQEENSEYYILTKSVKKPVSIFNIQCCEELYKYYNKNLSSSLCTARLPDEILTDPQKASVAVLALSGNQFYLDGISYYTLGDGLPIVHTKVSDYLEWIGTSIQVDEQCVAIDEEVGLCIHPYECTSLYKFFTNPIQSYEKFTHEVLCKGTTLACCPSMPNPAFIHRYNTKLEDTKHVRITDEMKNIHMYCGMQHTDDYHRDSENITIDEFPWLIEIVADPKTSNERTVCGGSIINTKYVLTAGTCANVIQKLPSVVVRLGQFKSNQIETCIKLPTLGAEDCNIKVDNGIEEVILHPYFSTPMNNIALIRLKDSIQYSDYIRPICLPTPKSETISESVGRHLYVTGFGKKSANKKEVITKKKFTTSLISKDECLKRYKGISYDLIISDYHICSLDSTNSTDGTCNGDGGGPIMYKHNYKWYVKGIVIFGDSCKNHLPGIDTKVFAYLDWINDNMKP